MFTKCYLTRCYKKRDKRRPLENREKKHISAKKAGSNENKALTAGVFQRLDENPYKPASNGHIVF